MKRDATWRELLSSRLPRDGGDVIRLYRALLEGLDTPVALGAYLRLKYNGLIAVYEMEVRPEHYLDRISYLDDAQAVKFLAKYPFKSPLLDPRQAAITTFNQCEATCEVENEFWMAYNARLVSLIPWFERIAFRVQQIITEILGDFPVQEWLDCCRFGPGTTAFSAVPKPSDADKLALDPTVTVEFYPYAEAFLAEFPGWTDALTFGGSYPLRVHVVQGGKHTTVLKKATTDRNIETQPTVNMFAQLGLGLMIRRRLREHAGIDLDHGQDRNREFARKGSLYGTFATKDLRNASDTICKMLPIVLVENEGWRKALCITRTATIRMAGEDSFRELHRFSAMGNGYTFELETLIFYAIARACTPKGTVLAYGDDLIVPTYASGDVSRALTMFGFTVNETKSFDSGPFRESCGADWFEGQISRPFQLENEVTNVPEVISLANGLARAACRSNRGYGFDRRYRAAWLLAYSWIPHRIRNRLAWGNPPGDEFLFMWKFRGDRFVVTTTETRDIDHYYKGKATALYRVYARRLKHVNAPSAPKSRVTVPTGQSVFSFVPGNPVSLFRDWGPNTPLGVDGLVHTIGWC